MRNRLANCHNQYQGDMPRILCVCSAGLLRSPSIAWVLSNAPYNYNTRAAGCHQDYALIVVDPVLIKWADGIVCAEQRHVGEVTEIAKRAEMELPPITSLDIPDNFDCRDPELIKIIECKVQKVRLFKRLP